MNSEDLHDVVDFLAKTLPFSALSDDERLEVARRLSIDYVPRQKQSALNLTGYLYLIRTGAFELRTQKDELIDRLGEHELFGVNTLLEGNTGGIRVFAIEDALVFKLSSDDFESLCDRYQQMHQFFQQISEQRHRQNRLILDRDAQPRFEQPLNQSVRQFAHLGPVVGQNDISIKAAAGIMREHRVSSLLLMKGDDLAGIVTDRDLRNRAVAEGVDLAQPVSSIATDEPSTIDVDAPLFDAQKLMTQQQIHHLPVMDKGRPIGMISATDLVRAQQVSPLYLINDIQRQTSLDTLAELRHKVPRLIHNWVQADTSPYEMGHVLAAIGDAFVQQCLRLAQLELGDAPMRFAWLAFGSQARMDQSFASDQDNALILAREPSAGEADYFASLSDWVCVALDQCGYVLCPGDIMARNPKWRRSVAGWQAVFDDWIDQPTPEALLNSSIFFDVRVIDGDASLLEPIQTHLAARVPKSDIFLAMLTQTAVRSRPPLGFFRQFVLKSSGEHEDSLDLKHRGVALVNDLARVYALASGIGVANTQDRLIAARVAGAIEGELAESLIEAWSLIAHLRIEGQSNALANDQEPTSFVDPDTLSSLTRAHLKDAFATIKRAQGLALQRYARGQLG
jgi:CBS domain-containing protein